MAPSPAAVSYKKKDGVLALSPDLRSVAWTPSAPPGAPPSVTISCASITNLQQTPANNPKVMLKVFVQAPDAPLPETHTFAFMATNTARAEADAVKDALSKSIQAAKAASTPRVPAAPGSGALAVASAVNATSGWFDDARLKADLDLQQSLLKSDPALQKTFMESLRTKPDSISNSQFTHQFWSMRLSMLRAHAIEKSQTRGAYNVLSTIKARTEDNVTRLSISKEQIQLIFNQHPLVKRVYDENVPKLNESEFWSKFFLSRLFRRLKGEKLVESDPLDPVLDRYLNEEDTRDPRRWSSHIPHTIDIEGNEENHSQRKGNQPDWTMRPAAADKVPIIRTLNSLSERIMSHVEPIDVDPSAPIGMDEETFNELALRDLQSEAQPDRTVLHIKDQKRFFADDVDSADADATKQHAAQVPADVLSAMRKELRPARIASDQKGVSRLQIAIGVDDDTDDEPEPDTPKTTHVGSQQSLSGATTQILGAIDQRRSHADDFSSTAGVSAVEDSTEGLSRTLFDRLTLTHATTTEFLRHFWQAFLSGDPARASELAKAVDSLKRAVERVQAVAAEAEEERNTELERKKKEIRDIYQSTGKKRKWDPSSVGGGSQAVQDMMAPTINAVNVALTKYKEALARQNARG
ncbi:MAG: RNA polymerase II transcription factor B subunit 1 [Thelocarpon superellum]|nr:MAG: RNA polymerase II transcription factor B subunit 1 [Thelocarpon superellum]